MYDPDALMFPQNRANFPISISVFHLKPLSLAPLERVNDEHYVSLSKLSDANRLSWSILNKKNIISTGMLSNNVLDYCTGTNYSMEFDT